MARGDPVGGILYVETTTGETFEEDFIRPPAGETWVLTYISRTYFGSSGNGNVDLIDSSGTTAPALFLNNDDVEHPKASLILTNDLYLRAQLNNEYRKERIGYSGIKL